jgi:hypothetical protein
VFLLTKHGVPWTRNAITVIRAKSEERLFGSVHISLQRQSVTYISYFEPKIL